MSQLYSFTPTFWLSFLTILLLLLLSVYSWRMRSVPGALPFAIGSLLALLSVAGSVMEFAALNVSTKYLWLKFGTIWQIPAVTALTCFVLEYTWPGRWLTRRNIAVFSFVALLCIVATLTNEIHHLGWLSADFEGATLPKLGPVGWIFLVYGYALGIVNILVLAWLFLHSPQHRWPVAIMVTGQIAARGAYLLDLVNPLHTDLPLEVFGIGFLFLMYAIVLYGFRIFDPTPMARQMAIEQMYSGMIVLDQQGKVTSMNPSAERILNMRASRAKGRVIKELLSAYPDGQLSMPEGTETEFTLGSGQEARHYTMVISPLKDWRGLEVGRLLLVRDVTEQKKAQAQVVEQQRALASLNERERMARELHDGIGQVLGYAGFQLDAASKLILDGKAESAVPQLNRLAGVFRDAHADVREYILNLRSAPSPQQPFFTVLQRYLEGFTSNYAIQTHLAVDTGLDDKTFSQEAQLQVFRIVQEALTNARKHGHARQVQLNFERRDGRVCVTIQDDGSGFEPGSLKMGSRSHLGLQFMRERSEELGGCLLVESSPGAGTKVILQVPVYA